MRHSKHHLHPKHKKLKRKKRLKEANLQSTPSVRKSNTSLKKKQNDNQLNIKAPNKQPQETKSNHNSPQSNIPHNPAENKQQNDIAKEVARLINEIEKAHIYMDELIRKRELKKKQDDNQLNIKLPNKQPQKTESDYNNLQSNMPHHQKPAENKLKEGLAKEIVQPTNKIEKAQISRNRERSKKILVATSITPNRIEIQKMAIDTWLKLGFAVVSLNTLEEVEYLKPHFPNIQFHIVERSAKERYGKPYVYIYDFMCYLNSADCNIVGIVNSDIHFKGVRDDFIDFINKEASDSLVYGHRLEVDNLDDNYGTLSNGVDYFFFDKKLISIYKDDGLCMGQPAWDWWMVCVAAAENKTTKRVLSKVALHLKHPQEWYESLNQYLIESIVFKKYLQKMYPDATKSELNSRMWEIVISKNGIEYPAEKNGNTLDLKGQLNKIPFISRPNNLKSILVATSIGPNRIDVQRNAIRTWLEAGFDVVSVNTREEINMLKPHFPEIKFHVADRSAIGTYGKPYIYIYDLMKVLEGSNYTVVGIINSDIHFKNVKPDLLNVIYEHALDSVVYGHRLDVNHINDSYGTVSNGVDYFFFNRNIIRIYEDDGLCMGQPAWDWWMVCLPASKHQKTKRILNPIGYHEIHPQQWDEGQNLYLIKSIVMEKYLRKLYPDWNSESNYYELNSKMWDIVISKSGIEI